MRPVSQLAVAQAGDAEYKADQTAIRRESPQKNAAHLDADLQHADGHDIGEIPAPGVSLNLDTPQHLFARLQRADHVTRAGPAFVSRIVGHGLQARKVSMAAKVVIVPRGIAYGKVYKNYRNWHSKPSGARFVTGW